MQRSSASDRTQSVPNLAKGLSARVSEELRGYSDWLCRVDRVSAARAKEREIAITIGIEIASIAIARTYNINTIGRSFAL